MFAGRLPAAAQAVSADLAHSQTVSGRYITGGKSATGSLKRHLAARAVMRVSSTVAASPGGSGV